MFNNYLPVNLAAIFSSRSRLYTECSSRGEDEHEVVAGMGM